MIDKYIQDLVLQQDDGKKMEERDLKLLKLLKEIDALPDDQKRAVLPHLKATLVRHEQIGKDRRLINKFFCYLDQIVMTRKNQRDEGGSSSEQVH